MKTKVEDAQMTEAKAEDTRIAQEYGKQHGREGECGDVE